MVAAVSSGRLGVRRQVAGEALTLRSSRAVWGESGYDLEARAREKNPTLVVAAKLAEGLGVTLSRLAGMEERREVVVVPRERRMVMRDPETGFERQLLSPNFVGRGVEFIRNAIPEGSTSGEFPPHRRGVEEHVVVERGRLRAMLGGEEYMLVEGDALYFEADVRRFDAGEGECSYYLVISSRGT